MLVMLGSLSLGKVNLSPLEVMRILFSSQDASLTLIVEQLHAFSALCWRRWWALRCRCPG